MPLGPDARYEQSESISLAFVTALQVLPPRQLAVLVLHDVLGFHASEVAEMLDSTVDSANSALKRARASLKQRRPTYAPISASEDAIVAEFVRAYEAADLDALVGLLTDDVFISMPPMPFVYEGRDAVARFCGNIFGAGRLGDEPVRRQRTPAFWAGAIVPDAWRGRQLEYSILLLTAPIGNLTREFPVAVVLEASYRGPPGRSSPPLRRLNAAPATDRSALGISAATPDEKRRSAAHHVSTFSRSTPAEVLDGLRNTTRVCQVDWSHVTDNSPPQAEG